LLKRIQNEIRRHTATGSPTHNSFGVGINHKGHVKPTLPGRAIREICNPQAVWAINFELAFDQIHRALRCFARHGGTYSLATANPFNAKPAHQAFDRTSGHCDPFTIHLLPNLAGTIHAKVLLPNAANIHHLLLIFFCALATQPGLTTPSGMAPVR